MSMTFKQHYGIDFGTTNSAVVSLAEMDSLAPIFHGDDERRPIPSIVAINRSTGQIITGREAWSRRSELSQTCEFITSVKSLLATEWSMQIAGTTWTPELIAAELFKAIQDNVFSPTNNYIEEAVIAIPVGLAPQKRNLIRKAAGLAGISVKSFISEPTAAFFANYSHVSSDTNVVVFDWGGGTLDVSVLENTGGRIKELATNSMIKAGNDIDLKMAQRIHARICRKKGTHIRYEDMPAASRDTLMVKVESAKRSLSDDDIVTLFMLNYGELGAIKETLDIEWFSELVLPDIDDAIKCLDDAIRMSGLGKSNIDRIIMVGGSSNLRPLTERLSEKFGDRLFFPDETMWSVSIGAAMISHTPGDYYSNQTIGIRLSDNVFFKLLGQNEPLNGWKVQHHFGIVDTSSEIGIVFSGSADIDESELKYHSLAIPSYKFLQEKIILEAFVDENLIFNVKAKSSMRTEGFSRRWQYDRLKCYYKIFGSSRKEEYHE